MSEIFLIISILAIAFLEILLLIRVKCDRIAKQVWQSLKSQATNTVFTPEMLANLDEPVQRYFLQAIKPGTPLATCVELEMSGSFRPKPDADWLPMQASQIISISRGFVWKATVGKGFNKFSGADYYYESKGRMRFSLWGLIPLVDAQHDNINRSDAGRLAVEYALWLPSALLAQNGVTWKAISDNTIQASFNINDEPITLTLVIDTDGKLLKFSLLRWGDLTETGDWQYIPFGGEVQASKTFGGYTIPTKINAGWWFGTDKYGTSFQPTIEQAQFMGNQDLVDELHSV